MFVCAKIAVQSMNAPLAGRLDCSTAKLCITGKLPGLKPLSAKNAVLRSTQKLGRLVNNEVFIDLKKLGL